MAQSGYTPIVLFHSTTTGNVPTTSNLAVGELAINNTDGKLFYNTGSAIAVLAGAGGAGIAGGSNTQVQYNSSGSLAGSANMTFSGTALTLANDASISGLTVGKGVFTSNSGAGQVVLGDSAMVSNTSGTNNTAIGSSALNANTTAYNNVAVGFQSMYLNTTGTQNTATGFRSLRSNTTGSLNAAFGQNALYGNTTGANNTALGQEALTSNTTASNNTAVGYQAGYTISTTTDLVAVGYQAGKLATGDDGTFIGFQAGAAQTTGGQNTYLGSTSGYLMTTGSRNTILGRFSGNQGGLDIRTASNYIVLSDGDGNPRGVFDNNGTYYVGNASAPSGTYNNIALSPAALAGGQNLSSSRNSTANSQHVTFFNPNGQVGGINTLASATVYGTSSDYRLKENIAPMKGALAKVSLLKPCTYTWKIDGTVGEGFIAHELQQVVEGCVIGEKDAIDSEGKPVYQNIDTSFLVATLTAAIQEQQAMIETLTTRLNALEGK